MRRRVWLVLLVFVAVLAAGDWAYWQMATQRLRQAINQWEDDLRAKGWEVGAGALSDSGWPVAARVSVANLTLRHGPQTVPGLIEVTAPVVTLSLPVIQPAEPRVIIDGPVHVRVDGLQDMVVTADQLVLGIRLRRSGPAPVSLRGQDTRLEAADGSWRTAVRQLTADASLDEVAGNGQSDRVAEFQVHAEGITLPPHMKWPLGQAVAVLQMQGVVHGPLPAAGPVTPAITPWAETWRNNGGSVEISHFVADWGPLALTGSATLALDEQLQPMGTGTAHLVGYAEALDRFAAAGLMTRSAATAAKAVLSLMAGVGEGDVPPAVDVPLTLQYRTLSMRQVPLVRFPELDWPPAR
ncbi:MAG TPA: DUF2125 domain-containing protein [Rhodopila sp.]|nr:DUF2125 domain-containing protein [Rhodopila sp.]